MPKKERKKTDYPGVFLVKSDLKIGSKQEWTYYIRYQYKGVSYEEPAGHKIRDKLTDAKANNIRSRKIAGIVLPKKIQREIDKKEAERKRWTINAIWKEYRAVTPCPSDFDSDKSRFDNHISKVFGSKLPSDLTPIQISRFRVGLSKKLSPTTTFIIIELLKRLVNFAVNQHLIPPLHFKIEQPKPPAKLPTIPTPSQINKLLEVLDGYYDKVSAGILLMELFTGMRRKEIFNLKWSDVDKESGIILIRDPKGKTPYKIPMNREILNILNNQPRWGSEYVFPGKTGGKRKSNYTSAVKIKKLAGLPEGFSPNHGYRHLFASAVVQSGESLYVAQHLLTHKNPATTQIYAHLQTEGLRGSSDRAAEFLRSAGKGEEDRENKKSG